VPQAEKFNAVLWCATGKRLIELQHASSTLKVTHVIWPEAAPPFFLEREPVALEQIRALTQSGVTLITGAERYSITTTAGRGFSTRCNIRQRRSASGSVRQIPPRPFGEYPSVRFRTKSARCDQTDGRPIRLQQR